MSYAKDGIKRRVVVFPLSGGACTVPAVLDFTRSRPGAAKTGPAAVPTQTGAALRFRATASGRSYVPVDPALLVLHLSFGEAGRICLMSEALSLFIGRCCAVSGAGGRKRLAVGGDPAVTTRAVCRGTEFNVEPRAFFHAKRCHVRGCTAPVVAGTLCAAHYDSTFSGGLTKRQAAQLPAVRCNGGVAAELDLVFGDYAALWESLAEWLWSAPQTAERARLYFVNHAVDALPLIAMGTASADRVAALVHCAHPTAQGTQAFYNAHLLVAFIRTIRTSLPVLAGNTARSLATMHLYGLPWGAPGAQLLCDRGLVPFCKMPVLPKLEAFVGNRAALFCSTVVPDLGEEPVAVVFNVVALSALSRIFGSLGEFSFTVLTGTLEVPDGALVLDAAEPLDLAPFMKYSGLDRANKVLYVLTPAALSPTVLHAIVFRLGFKHVYFCGPRFGAGGIRLPVFASGTGDPTVGWLWLCILDEAASRGQIRSSGTGDPLWRRGGRGFLDTFVTAKVPGRCAAGCAACTPTSSWHVDQLVAEAAFGEAAPALLPPCARTGTELFDMAEAVRAVRLWRTLCDLTTETIFSEDP